MKEFAKIISLSGGYTYRSKEAGSCEKNKIYELVKLNKRTATLKNSMDETFPVNSTDIKCLTSEEIYEMEFENDDMSVDVEPVELELKKPIPGCTGVQKVKKDTSEKPIKENSYVLMVAAGTECRIEDSEEKYEVETGQVFFCERIQNACAYVYPTYHQGGVLLKKSFKVIVPAVYFKPYTHPVLHPSNNDIQLEDHNMKENHEPIHEDMPFDDESTCGDCECGSTTNDSKYEFGSDCEHDVLDLTTGVEESSIEDLVAKTLALYLLKRLE